MKSRKIVAGNWKMNKSMSEAQSLVQDLNKLSSEWSSDVKVIISPPMAYQSLLATVVSENVYVAAQNCHWESKGAFTGEVSADQLRSSGITHCIIGHSERRQYFGETDQSVNLKVKACLNSGVTPIICVGEKLEEREAGNQNQVVSSQLKGALVDLTPEQTSACVIAYEPVWAIGTGKTATADQAQEIHGYIRTILAELGADSDSISILYGGSCKPTNAKEIFSKPDVDGGLIGGASLNAEDFNAIINSY